MADDSLQDLSRQLQLARRSLDEMARSARSSADATKKVGDEAEGAAESAVALQHAVTTVNEAFSNLSRMAGESAVSALTNFISNIPQAAAGAERHQTALRQLGGAYAYVQQATNGVVSAEQAALVQQRALQSGLRLSAQELAAVTARARDFARSTGTDINQALEQLTDQLINPGEELSKFGIRLQAGTEAGDAMREALRQLQQQAAQTAPAQASLAETLEMTARAQREASDALSGFIAKRLELRDFFTQFTSYLDDTVGRIESLGDAFDAVKNTIEGTVLELLDQFNRLGGPASLIGGSILSQIPGLRAIPQGLQSVSDLFRSTVINPQQQQLQQRLAAQNQSASGAFIEQAGPLAQQLRGRGFNLRGVRLGEVGVQATPEQRRQLLQLLQRNAATAGRATAAQQAELDTALSGLTSQAQRGFAEREAARRAEEARIAAEREAEIRRRNEAQNAQARQAAASAAAAAAARARQEDERRAREEAERLTREPFRRLPTDTAGLASFFAGFRPGAERVQAGLGTADIATRSAIERMTSEQAALEALDLTGRRQEGQRQELLARGQEGAAGRLQVQALQERRTALLDLLEANKAYMDQAREANASEQSMNDLLTQRIGLQTALAETTRALTEEQYRMGEGQQFVLEKATELVGVLGGSLVDAAFAAMDAQSNAGATFAQVMEDQTRSFLRNLAKQSVVSALQETAKGVGALAMGNLPGALGHFKSAGFHAAAAAAAGLGAAAMGPQVERGAAAGATGAAAGGASVPTSARTDDRQTGGGGPLNLTINVSGAAFTDIGVQQAVGSALREAVGTGVIRRDQLVGLFGG